MSDLIEKLEWAKLNDEEAQNIAKRGSKAALDILTPENVLCYYAEALITYRYQYHLKKNKIFEANSF